MPFKFISPEEAASFIKNDNIVGFGGFTAAGAPKVIPGAIAQTAENEHKNGRPFRIGVITGASTGESLDGCLSRAEAIKFRTPYQSHKELRDDINNGKTDYFDIHLSRLASEIRYGHMGKINTAIVEICDYTEETIYYDRRRNYSHPMPHSGSHHIGIKPCSTHRPHRHARHIRTGSSSPQGSHSHIRTRLENRFRLHKSRP